MPSEYFEPICKIFGFHCARNIPTLNGSQETADDYGNYDAVHAELDENLVLVHLKV